MRPLTLAGPILAIALAVGPTAQAATWNVYADGSGDAPTIQAAIDLATAGDQVLIHAGTYVEYLTMKDGVSLVGVDGAEFTTVQAPGSTHDWTPVIDASHVGATTWLYGLTIGGGGTAVGVHGTNCSLQIRNNRFIDNLSTEGFQGAAIQLTGDGSPHVEGNTFQNNQQYTHHGYGIPGGTLYIATTGHTTIRSNEFRDNGDTWSGLDGGIAVEGDCTIDDNLIINCEDQDAGLTVWGGEAIITGNIVAGSKGTSTYDQSPSTCGISASVTSGWIGNNTVYNNRPEYWFRPPPDPAYWSGIRARVSGEDVGLLHIERNLVARNDGGGIYVLTPQYTVLSCNLTWQNAGNDLQGIAPDAGHLFADPYFCDAENLDFRVVDNSPAAAGACGIVGAINETCATTSGVGIPTAALALRAVPNPFNPTTTIHVSVPVPGRVTIEVYDVTGRRVRTLFDRTVDAGEMAVTWDGTDARGARGPSGVYFVRLTASGLFTTEKIVLLK